MTAADTASKSAKSATALAEGASKVVSTTNTRIETLSGDSQAITGGLQVGDGGEAAAGLHCPLPAASSLPRPASIRGPCSPSTAAALSAGTYLPAGFASRRASPHLPIQMPQHAHASPHPPSHESPSPPPWSAPCRPWPAPWPRPPLLPPRSFLQCPRMTASPSCQPPRLPASPSSCPASRQSWRLLSARHPLWRPLTSARRWKRLL